MLTSSKLAYRDLSSHREIPNEVPNATIRFAPMALMPFGRENVPVEEILAEIYRVGLVES